MPHEVLIVTGPPGSGKTTVARLLAARRDRAVHLESDGFFHFVASGYIEPWRRESHAQNTIVMQAVADAAARYALGGYFTIVDGILSPRWFFEPLRDALLRVRIDVAYAILRPAAEIAVERAAARPSSRLADAAVVEQLWRDFADLDGSLEAHAVDNGELSTEETVSVIEERLRRGALAVSR